MLLDHISREMFDEIQRFGIVVLALLGLWRLQSEDTGEQERIREEFFACSEARERSRYHASFHRHGSD